MSQLERQAEQEEESDYEERKDNTLPGSKGFDKSSRKLKCRVECRQIKFSPSEDSWVVCTSEGLMVFGNKNM